MLEWSCMIPFTTDPKYRGPADGLSRPAGKAFRTLARAAFNVTTRVQVEGRENLPEPGGVLLCPNHPGLAPDTLVPHVFWDGDMRTMVSIGHFHTAPRAAFSQWTGAFPVDKTAPSQVTKDHAVEVLKNGSDLLIFPEGEYSDRRGELNPLRRGAASFAIKSGAKALVPVAIHYRQDDQRRLGSEVLAGAFGLGVGLLTGLAGAGPAAAIAGPLLGAGALASLAARSGGSWLLERLSNGTDDKGRLAHDPMGRLGLTAAGAVVGGVAGGVLALALGPPTWLSAGLLGLGAFQLARNWIHRDLVQVRVGQPIPVEPYVTRYGPREANTQITQELHRRIGRELTQLTGQPYDDTAPKIE
ncbi:MAG: lysophospholipid acyltransferase family protein [Candidatus Eremiobacterota bacterium]